MLVTGATGSGKTTTLAAMIDHINRTRRSTSSRSRTRSRSSTRTRLHRQPARGRARHRVVPPGAPPALRQDPDVILIGELRDAETAADGAPGRRVRPPRALDHAHGRRNRDDRPHDRVLPRRQAAADPLDPRRRAARRGQPAPAPAASRRPRRGGRGDGEQRAHRRPDPREPGRGDPEAIEEGAFFDMQTFTQALIDLVVSARSTARSRRTPRPTATTSWSRSSTRSSSRPPTSKPSGRLRDGAEPPKPSETRAGCGSSGAGRDEAARCRLLVALAPPARPRRRLRGSCRRSSPTSPTSCRAPRPRTRRARSRSRVALRRRRAVQSSPTTSCSALWQQRRRRVRRPVEVLAAINKIESNFGRNMGPSSAGAIGWMQFMPSTWLRWGTDADGDGIADPWNAERRDLLAAARYLAASGGATDISRGGLLLQPRLVVRGRGARSSPQLFGAGGGCDADLRARPAAGVARRSTGRRSTHARRQLALRPSATLRALAAAERALAARGIGARCSPTGSTREQRAGRSASGVSAAQARVGPLQAALDARRADELAGAAAAGAGGLVRARPPARCSARAGLRRAATSSRSAAAPRVVSVSHHHHDYPAADIAAPEGSPLYALADATVVYAWRRTTSAAASASRSRPPTGGPGPTATSRTSTRRSPPGRSSRRAPGRARRADRSRDRPAPASPAPAGDLVPAGRSPGSRTSRASPSAGRTPGRPTRSARAGHAPVFAVVPHQRRIRVHRSSCSPGRGMTSRLSAAEGKDMAVRLAALLPRAVIVALVWILGTAAFTLAADNTIVGPSTPDPRPARPRRRPSWSCRRSAARPTCSPRGSSRTPASPGASSARCAATPRTASSPRARLPAPASWTPALRP